MSIPNPKVSIIIPVYRLNSLFNQCINSLKQTINEDTTEIIVVRSSGSFAENCNRGIAMAKGEYICLLNDDCVTTEGWLEPLIEILEQNPKAGAVSPMMLFPPERKVVNKITSEQNLIGQYIETLPSKVQFAGMVFHEDYCGGHLGWGWKEDDSRLLKEPTQFQATTFGCVLLRKKALLDSQLSLFNIKDKTLFEEFFGENFGDFLNKGSLMKAVDESYKVGGYEDIDTCFRMKLKGWEIWYQPKSKIFHYESQTFNSMSQEKRKEASNENRKIYLSRWKQYFDNGTFKMDDVDFAGGVWKGYVE